MSAMDVTPQLIEQIDFSEKFRGYDPDQVDDFLERVGATLAELSKTTADAVQRAERAEAELRNAPQGGATRAPVAAMSDEEEAMQSTRTLMMAKRTADAAIADARQEAQKLLADTRAAAEQQQREAQTEADRIVGEARVNADQMTQKATAEANREYGARRDQILAEIGELENRKVGKAGQLTAIEARLEEYRGALTTIHGAIGAVLDDPETALRSPLPGIDLAGASQPVFEAAAVEPNPFDVATASTAPSHDAPADDQPFEAHAFEPSGDPDTGADAGFSDAGFSQPAFSDAPFSDAGFSEPAFSEPAFSDAAFSPVDGDDADDRTAYNGTGGSHFGDATLLDPNDLAVPYGDGSGSDPSGAADLPWSDTARVDDGSGTDPWGPGSWGEVASFPDSSDAFSPASESVEQETATHSFGEFPSDGLPVIGQDRYTRDLDQAVNQPDESHDDAMSAFFEGDDDHQTRRFGRRR